MEDQPNDPSQPAPPSEPEDRKERLELYKLMVEMADRVSQRRQAANSFYLSINTLLVTGSAYIGATAPSARNSIIILLAGLITCFLWRQAIESYKTLNTAKFKILHQIEARLCEKPYLDEWELIDPKQNGKEHRPFYRTEHVVPFVFMGVFAFEGLASLPWQAIFQALRAHVCR